MPATKAEARRWHKFYQSHSMRETAEQFGTTAATVSNTFRRHGLAVRGRNERSASDAGRRLARIIAGLHERGAL